MGADETAFQKLEEVGRPKVMVKWLKHKAKESLCNYSNRLISEYKISESDIVVGLSFGGLVAQQIADILSHKCVILISSMRSKDDLNTVFKTGLNSSLYKLMPTFKVPIISEIVANFLNSGSKESKPVLKKMLDNTDMELLQWSLQKIYEQDKPIGNKIKKYNIIGSKDKIMRQWSNASTYKIEGGSHFMVFDKSPEISSLLRQIISAEN